MRLEQTTDQDDLRPEANPRVNPQLQIPAGDHLTPCQLTEVARLQTEFAERLLGPHLSHGEVNPQISNDCSLPDIQDQKRR